MVLAIDNSNVNLQELTLHAPVVKVTLLEDRAMVQRRGKANFTTGLWRIKVSKVTPVLSDKSLRAELDNSLDQVNDVRSRRRMLLAKEEQPEELQAALTEYGELIREFEYLRENRLHHEYSFGQFSKILLKALEEIPEDAVWGQLDPMSWRSQFETLFQQLRTFRGEILKNYHEQENLAEIINGLIEKIEILAHPGWIYTADIEADLTITSEGEKELIFEYLVPNALWRPAHQARLLMEENPTVEFRSDACVWQNTGEDWNDVELVFSTARGSLGTEPPLLEDDILYIKEKSSDIVIQIRDERVQTTGPSGDDSIELLGVDDGGEVRNLQAHNKATIPSDGCPYRVTLFSFSTSAEIEYVLMPEVTPMVILKTEQDNKAYHPILAGPVDLIRSSEFVGKTSLLFVAQGERFALGWGPDPAIQVQRTQGQQRKQNNLTRWNSVITTVKLFLSNLANEVREIKTTERIPVSEIEEVYVEVLTDQTTYGIQADENGFCNWIFTLEPYSQLRATLVYKVDAAPEVKGF